MQTFENTAHPIAAPVKERERPRYVPHLGKLATFIEHHGHINDSGRNQDHNIIEVRRTDAEIAFHLGISMEALDRCFSELVRQNVIRLRSANQIEILNNARLAEIARQV
ncbi:helix-turn-helix domain-containing protein [Hyphomicrobium sp.]|jgi:hypothetical protein|uniref:helix-turn-helix domain-containing protein n=1 Tax=Hyphomicrobium sp. TaxID=82 RepID=UPI002C64F6D1|nr:helix-turn-helix domain-containing protein [Hyphomicrobium sp.]HVZ05997.1 helix-turn-helix domain-containing protein [Hyphomicrobium sp.]